uniref:Lymphocyte cytosolic protein 2 isoform X1 n=2 Tax=Pogona vitticeps TaxID=103695 RepID=A0ABM5FLS6_9SAUR
MMDSRNTPYRSEVVRWSPDDLADYFRRLNFKDCEKIVKKHNINGQRFLNLSENDIQKFPKLRMPILSKLSQEINRHEERKSFFPKRVPTQKPPDFRVVNQDEDGGWSSFEESDDYESPDDDPEDGVDYETPNDNGIDDENDADYEPPPSNDDDALRNVIFPSKSMPATSEYIDRPATERSKAALQPPVPPQRPGSSPTPLTPRGARDTGQPPFLPPTINNESNRVKSIPSFKPPSVDRSKKPPLDRSAPPFDRDLLGAGKRSYPEMSLAPQLRSLGAELAKIQKPPVPSTERCERNNPPSRKKQPPMKNSQISERKAEMDDDGAPQRPVPQPSFNTFPFRSKPPSKQSPLPPRITPDAYPESAAASSVSLPPHFQSSSISRTFSKGPADGRPPLPIPNRQTVQYPKAEKDEMEHCQMSIPPSEPKFRFGSGAGSHREAIQGPANQKWYVADITRPEAEVALRNMNKDGTYLVRDSSRKTLEQPYVLMVLYNNKVYNIQIRYKQEHSVYFLGTGMNANEEFTSVAEIIDHFQRTPLLLIDGKDRGSRKQCMLTYAAKCL